jgi:hypothetical protein
MFYENKLTIYSNTDFFGKTVQECLDNEANYWNNFLKLLQIKLGVLLIKRNKTKIYEFRKHIAKVNDPLAKKVLKRNKDFFIYDDSGELIFVIDDSFKFIETESVHKTKSVRNAKRYEGLLKDLDRNPEGLYNGELTEIASLNVSTMKELIEIVKEIPILKDNITTLQTNQLRTEKKMQELIEMNTILTKNVIALTQKPIKEENKFNPKMDYFN